VTDDDDDDVDLFLTASPPPQQHAAADTARHVHRAGTTCRARRRTKTDSLLQDARGLYEYANYSHDASSSCVYVL